MQKSIFILCIFMLPFSVYGQIAFTYEAKQLTLLGQLDLSSSIVFDSPVAATDHEWVALFKNYFHPVDIAAYQDFFPANEWIGMSIEKFNEWQARIQKEKLFLNHVFHVQANDQKEYLVFQYTMEKPQYSLAKSMIMIKSQGEWKYINFQKNEHVAMLKQLGRMNSQYISDRSESKTNIIALDALHPDHQRKDVEKFDRVVLFEKFSQVFTDKGVSASDIAYAQELFLSQDDRNVIDYLSNAYQWDHIDLMTAINDKCGFPYFNFVRNSEAK